MARAQDYRRRLRERAGDWPFKLERFAFQGIPSLGEGELLFQSPLTVISGPNGVGKTTLLRAIWAAAKPEKAAAIATTTLKLQRGTVTLNFRMAEEAKSSEVTLASEDLDGGTPLDVDVVHLDSASEVADQQRLFSNASDVEDLINGVGARALEGPLLGTLNYLAKRNYRAAQVYEVELERDLVVPFFEVALGNDRYDSRTMGTGELAIFFLWWSLDRASENAMVLIEEPECYLSPASQETFCNFLIQTAVEKRLTVVATSHSPQFIAQLSEENLIFAFRQPRGIQVVEGNPPPALLETIGITPRVDTVILVEDEAGKAFCRYILERLRPGFSRRIEISPRGGEGNITTTLKRVGGQFDAVTFIGLYDGDVRDAIPEEVRPFSVVLPGKKPIEIELRELVESDPSALTNAIGAGDLEAILFGLQGSNHHDWYEGLCRQLGLSKQALFPTLFQIWSRREENLAAAKATVEGLLAITGQ
jgi:predicted ATPase